VTTGSRPLSRAAIIAVGSELLTPLRIDTNSLFLTEQLNALGVDVVFKAVAGDDRTELAALIRLAIERVDLVVLTGGLGPTDDDVTREVAADVLQRPLAEDMALTERLWARFAARYNGPMPEINRRQSLVPEGARVIENARGSAPGLWMEHGEGRVVLLLPGPPRELKPMVEGLAAGLLRERASGALLRRRIIRIAGRIESQAEELLRPLYERWAGGTIPISATILAALGQLELHLSVRTGAEREADAALEAATADVVGIFGIDVFSTAGAALEEVVGELLAGRGLTIAVAESCTGGLITSRLTDVAGSSRYVERGVISYSNEAKTELLGVPAELIAAHGAVSEAVALAMADGVRARSRVAVGVGVTGIAGPGGGSEEKPVGTVAVAAVTADVTRSRVFRFLGEREQVKFQASQAALDMVRRIMLEGMPADR
jgi:nicotinamide-nucleotide amidase